MHKILLIVKREYLSRVKKKSFLVATFLVPVLFVGMITLVGYLTAKQGELGDKKKVVVVDESGRFTGKLKNASTLLYTFTCNDIVKEKKQFIDSGYDYLLYIPASLTGIQLLGEKKPNAFTGSNIEDALTGIIRQQRLLESGIDTAILAKAQKPLVVKSLQFTEHGLKDSQSGVAFAVGMAAAFLIYMSLFIYGSQVMRGVIEEKVSRIIEVIISSVKPFQLMMGKIIGVGMVGLTQFLLWIILTITISTLGGSILMKNSEKAQKARMEQVRSLQKENGAAMTVTNGDTAAAASDDIGMSTILSGIDSIPVTLIVCCFLFYFLFGYFLYSAVFAAVGSAVDNETETQQFMLPITLPLIFTFMMSQTFIINNPDSSLAFWLSIIPFTSPIAMMIRLPFGVPAWQLALSMFLMIGGFIFVTWAAARIYRVGILMYGKKASYKELAKWFRYKE